MLATYEICSRWSIVAFGWNDSSSKLDRKHGFAVCKWTCAICFEKLVNQQNFAHRVLIQLLFHRAVLCMDYIFIFNDDRIVFESNRAVRTESRCDFSVILNMLTLIDRCFWLKLGLPRNSIVNLVLQGVSEYTPFGLRNCTNISGCLPCMRWTHVDWLLLLVETGSFWDYETRSSSWFCSM